MNYVWKMIIFLLSGIPVDACKTDNLNWFVIWGQGFDVKYILSKNFEVLLKS